MSLFVVLFYIHPVRLVRFVRPPISCCSSNAADQTGAFVLRAFLAYERNMDVWIVVVAGSMSVTRPCSSSRPHYR